jgi:hypothetical protein
MPNPELVRRKELKKTRKGNRQDPVSSQRLRKIRAGNAAGAAGFCRPAGARAAGGSVNPGLRPGLLSVAPPALGTGDEDVATPNPFQKRAGSRRAPRSCVVLRVFAALREAPSDPYFASREAAKAAKKTTWFQGSRASHDPERGHTRTGAPPSSFAASRLRVRHRSPQDPALVRRKEPKKTKRGSRQDPASSPRLGTIRAGSAAGTGGFCRPAGARASGGPVNPGSRPGLSSVAPPALGTGDRTTSR